MQLEDFSGENSRDTKKLDEELKPYIYHDELFGTCLKHPLVFQIPFVSWKLANQSLAEKERKIQEYLAEGQYDLAIWLYERPYRLSTLYEWWVEGEISNDILRQLLPHVWMDTENPEQFGNAPLEMFEALGYVSDTNKVLEGELTIYRGTQSKDEIGIEWSLHREVAEWFARRWATPSTTSWLMTAKVDADDILAYLVTRGEAEVIVNPEKVRDLKIEQLPYQPQEPHPSRKLRM